MMVYDRHSHAQAATWHLSDQVWQCASCLGKDDSMLATPQSSASFGRLLTAWRVLIFREDLSLAFLPVLCTCTGSWRNIIHDVAVHSCIGRPKFLIETCQLSRLSGLL